MAGEEAAAAGGTTTEAEEAVLAASSSSRGGPGAEEAAEEEAAALRHWAEGSSPGTTAWPLSSTISFFRKTSRIFCVVVHFSVSVFVIFPLPSSFLPFDLATEIPFSRPLDLDLFRTKTMSEVKRGAATCCERERERQDDGAKKESLSLPTFFPSSIFRTKLPLIHLSRFLLKKQNKRSNSEPSSWPTQPTEPAAPPVRAARRRPLPEPPSRRCLLRRLRRPKSTARASPSSSAPQGSWTALPESANSS